MYSKKTAVEYAVTMCNNFTYCSCKNIPLHIHVIINKLDKQKSVWLELLIKEWTATTKLNVTRVEMTVHALYSNITHALFTVSNTELTYSLVNTWPSTLANACFLWNTDLHAPRKIHIKIHDKSFPFGTDKSTDKVDWQLWKILTGHPCNNKCTCRRARD